MKRILSVAVGFAVLALVAGAAVAHGPGAGPGWWGMGPGMMGGGPGAWGTGPGASGGPGAWGMGPGMMYGGSGAAGCPGLAATGTPTPVTEEKAKELASTYAERYLPGYTVEKVLPFAGRSNMTMYSVELKGPNDEIRVLHVNPFGNVMPFGGPWRRGT